VVQSTLNDIEPDRFVDGASGLSPGERAIPINATRSSTIARRLRARFVVSGTITRTAGRPDPVQVAVTLLDLERELDTTVVSSGTDSTIGDIAVSAVVGLLPRLTGLEQQINPASLVGRSPAAVSNWLRGEREYRSSRIHAALARFRLAVAADSSLAPAAIRGAMAAMLVPDEREATSSRDAATRLMLALSG
jgi:hypothetical protein